MDSEEEDHLTTAIYNLSLDVMADVEQESLARATRQKLRQCPGWQEHARARRALRGLEKRLRVERNRIHGPALRVCRRRLYRSVARLKASGVATPAEWEAFSRSVYRSE